MTGETVSMGGQPVESEGDQGLSEEENERILNELNRQLEERMTIFGTGNGNGDLQEQITEMFELPPPPTFMQHLRTKMRMAPLRFWFLFVERGFFNEWSLGFLLALFGIWFLLRPDAMEFMPSMEYLKEVISEEALGSIFCIIGLAQMTSVVLDFRWGKAVTSFMITTVWCVWFWQLGDNTEWKNSGILFILYLWISSLRSMFLNVAGR